MSADIDAATHRIAAVLTEEGFGECDGTLAVPTGVSHMGAREMTACQCCYGLAHAVVIAAFGIEDERCLRPVGASAGPQRRRVLGDAARPEGHRPRLAPDRRKPAMLTMAEQCPRCNSQMNPVRETSTGSHEIIRDYRCPGCELVVVRVRATMRTVARRYFCGFRRAMTRRILGVAQAAVDANGS